MENKAIIEGVLQEFAGLAKHPRKSYHEKAVSDYIVSRLAALGITAKQDGVYNVIADIPATPGYEAAPVTMLQGHMDMVCVAKPDRTYDPLTDEIVLKRDGNILSADGTSLGADDGMAIAISLFLIQQPIVHGPLRLVFTVDEEVSMTGATHLDPAHVQDVRYIINIDSESIEALCVASAGSSHATFTRQLSRQKADGQAALVLKAAGFIGGHSGETINEGKSNAIKAIAIGLQRLAQAGIAYTLAAFDGGDAANAIPSHAQAVIVLPADQVEKAQDILAAGAADHKLVYTDIETSISLTAEPAALPEQTVSPADTKAIVQLLNLLHTGVFADRKSVV